MMGLKIFPHIQGVVVVVVDAKFSKTSFKN